MLTQALLAKAIAAVLALTAAVVMLEQHRQVEEMHRQTVELQKQAATLQKSLDVEMRLERGIKQANQLHLDTRGAFTGSQRIP